MSETSEPVLLRRTSDPNLYEIQARVLDSFLRFQMMEPEQIAGFLIEKEVKAKPGNYCECALAEYFRKIVVEILPELLSKHYIEVQCDSITIELDAFGRIVLPVPDGNLRRFMEDFDEEIYPDLIEERESDDA